MIRLIQRGTQPRWLSAALIGCALLATFIITAIPIRLAGANPGAAYQLYLIKPLTNSHSLSEVILSMSPLMFTGLAVAIAFRAGFWNIGAEGQFIAGAIATTFFAITFKDLPAPVAIPLVLVAGAVAGALWVLLPALLRVRLGIDEVVTTLLLNPVALLVLQGLLNGPWRNPESGFPESELIGAGYQFPRFIPGTRIHLGVLIAAILVIAFGIIVARTALGLRLRAVGMAPAAAKFDGIKVSSMQLRAALISGGVAGLGGVAQVAGLRGQLTSAVSSGYGYTGIVVATLAGLTAIGILVVSFLLATVTVGAESAARVLELPPQMGQVVSASLLLTVVGFLAFRRYQLEIRTPSGKVMWPRIIRRRKEEAA